MSDLSAEEQARYASADENENGFVCVRRVVETVAPGRVLGNPDVPLPVRESIVHAWVEDDTLL